MPTVTGELHRSQARFSPVNFTEYPRFLMPANKRNRDRTLGARTHHVGILKLKLAEEVALAASTNPALRIRGVDASVVEPVGYRALLDCDAIFCCTDSPWPRRVLNQIANAHAIPVIDGGILVRVRRERLIGADWRAHTVAPGRKCLECIGAYDPSLVGLEQSGKLEDPSYLQQLDPDSPLVRNENVFPFSMNVASLEVLQLMALLLGPVHNLGHQNYHYATGVLDRDHDDGCEPGCLYPPDVALGDLAGEPTGFDHRAARLRSSRVS